MYLSSDDLYNYLKKEKDYIYYLDLDIKNAIYDDDIKPPRKLTLNNDAEKVESLIWNVLLRGIVHTMPELNYKQIRFNVSDKVYKKFKNNIDANEVSNLFKELKVHEIYKQSKKYVDEYVNDKNCACSPLEEFFLNVQKLTEELMTLVKD